jgi:hypothetical protein
MILGWPASTKGLAAADFGLLADLRLQFCWMEANGHCLLLDGLGRIGIILKFHGWFVPSKWLGNDELNKI